MSSTIDSVGISNSRSLDVENAVRERYTAASQAAEPALCCPVDYNRKFLEVLPADLIERDYGCGDPSQYVHEGETVLDLGSGGGKICYIASQVVGPTGQVFGVDMNDDMLALARQYQAEVTQKIGWDNVQFFKGRIQDLGLNLDTFETYLAANPVDSTHAWLDAQHHAEELRRGVPMIATDSVDVVVSNCVLNLVSPAARQQLFAEVFRVLKRGGRAVISDIVSDEEVPERLQHDPKLWSGCMSGAFTEHGLLAEFEEAGFYGIEILARQDEPWAIVEGIEFRSMTVCAFKGKQGPCMDHNQAVIYQGPWKSVTDDDGHVLRRGVRTAVCEKTYRIYNQAPYADQIIPVAPNQPVADEDAVPYDCRRNQVRAPRETKGETFSLTSLPDQDCCSSGGCC